jgi:hypothetical protein
MNLNTEFKRKIILAFIGAAAIVLAASIPIICNNAGNKLASKEITETRNSDGTTTKRQMEIYK